MDYYSNEQLLKYFETEITNSSKKRLTALRKEIDEMKERQLRRVEEEIKTAVNRTLEVELKEINTDHSFEINKIKSENAKILMNKRQELLNDIFKEVGKRILHFSKTKKYEELMSKKILDLNPRFKNKTVVFNIRKDDTSIQKVIADNFSETFEIIPVDSIELGGFTIACSEMGIEINETLDNKLNDKKQWFYEESNLYII